MIRLLFAVLIGGWVLLGVPFAGLAQDAPPVTYERYDAAFDVQPDGTLLIVGIAWILGSRWMPQRRPAGAIEAAKWRAFRRYLLNLEDYGD